MASSSTSSSDKPNTLSNVVSNLVRASMGTSLSPTVTDEDLDRHVAELILREAKKKAEKYGQQGIRAYIASNLRDSDAPRTNKRFLSSIIRSTDDHNKAILRAQAEAAEEIKQARREKEKKERRARAEEAVRARKSGDRHRHRSSQSSRSTRRTWREQRENDREDGWDRWNGRTVDREKDRKKLKTKCWEVSEEEEVMEYDSGQREEKRNVRDKGKGRERSRTPDTDDRDKRRSRNKHDNDDEDRRRRRRRSRSESPRRRALKASTSRRHSPSPQPRARKERKYALDDLLEEDYGHGYKNPSSRNSSNALEDDSDTYSAANYDERRGRCSSHIAEPTKLARSDSSSRRPHLKSKSRSSSPNTTNTRSMSLASSRSSSPSPGPSPPRNLPSKMDKYFEESYDPRLDVTPLSTVPNVPSTGLINNAEFEGWDAMLELIQLRRQDKEDKKRLERLGLLPKKDKKGKGKVKAGVVESASVINGSGGSIFDIEYKKRGTVREWDLGKEGVDLSF